MEIISILNSKGGVGKTTTSVTLATLLAERGVSTLFVDMAPQANGSLIFIDIDENDEYDISNFLKANGKMENPLRYLKQVREDPDLDPIRENLYILSSSEQLNYVTDEIEIDSLKNGLALLEDYFDVVIIDNDPGLNILAKNSLVASTQVVIPVKMDLYSFQGSKAFLRFINKIKSEHNPGLKINGFLPTLYKEPGNDKYVLSQFNIYYNNEFIMKNVIRDRVSSNKAQILRLPLPIYDKKDECVLDYMRVLLELELLEEEDQTKLRDDVLALNEEINMKKEKRRGKRKKD